MRRVAAIVTDQGGRTAHAAIVPREFGVPCIVRWMLAHAIAAARSVGKPIGICGQAPSDYPELASWLVKLGIDSVSLNPDVAIRTTLAIHDTEAPTAPVEKPT